jgi:hypothetical protein
MACTVSIRNTRTIRNQFALGCDGVIMHGATPTELAPIVAAYKA